MKKINVLDKINTLIDYASAAENLYLLNELTIIRQEIINEIKVSQSTTINYGS